ncbi:hypothetical protein Sez_1734 [Streptococcus equi subsp. zooepidemicus MGCS10565]|uniref:Uncharacterized protein n=1 Tax=Streptococcus equi subsp. zooepidemicus (strain MGCS10565) TaxID=552526 RepID=B4U4V4_STREM|nr:hypothetical protein Sez_1692 [Streptococcus equi subsp. zooepidemicus MGCS10565]ACG63061.1 hypothetical protein Sez_1734 [Streptococcus equi subsp. zooepidemicus MGCS10565]
MIDNEHLERTSLVLSFLVLKMMCLVVFHDKAYGIVLDNQKLCPPE